MPKNKKIEEKISEQVEQTPEISPEIAQEATPEVKVPKFKVERKATPLVPSAKKYPDIRAGICEFCGILDKNVPIDKQYTICPHYQGVDIFCTYCGKSEDIIKDRALHIYELDEDPGKLVIVCDDYACRNKHNQRFNLGR